MRLKQGIISILAIFLFCTQNVFASKLPDDVWNFVKSNLPNARQRFDSVITLNQGIMYIPLYPPSTSEVAKIQIEYTYPKNSNFKNLPEVVLLNNGYSFLKVFKDSDGHYSVTKNDNLPIKVRLGLMPQDMLTPVGLKIPESLKLTLGDLLIPSENETSLVIKDDEESKTQKYSNTKKNAFITCNELKNKKILVNPMNSKFVEVYDNASNNALYELKLTSMPLKIVTSSVSDLALVLYWSTKQIDIINLKDENVVAKINIDAPASDVVLNRKDNIAYVSSQNSNSIYIIDLSSMQLSRIIKLDQKPSKIAYCETDNTIAFFDEFSSRMFKIIQQDTEYTVVPLGETKSVSKVLCDNSKIYALSRTQGVLYVFDKIESKLLSTVELDKKPTDAILYGGKLFILCSKDGYMDIYDIVQDKIIKKEQLSTEGFYSKITLIPNEKNILITGINSKNYLIYNLDEMKLTKKQESYIDAANIVITDKNQRL